MGWNAVFLLFTCLFLKRMLFLELIVSISSYFLQINIHDRFSTYHCFLPSTQEFSSPLATAASSVPPSARIKSCTLTSNTSTLVGAAGENMYETVEEALRASQEEEEDSSEEEEEEEVEGIRHVLIVFCNFCYGASPYAARNLRIFEQLL